MPFVGEKNPLGRQKSAKDSQQEAWAICLAWQRVEDLAGSGGATESQIRRVINETLTRVGATAIESPTVREWLGHWIESKTGIVATATLANYQHAVRIFLEWLGKRADARLESITSMDISGFRDHLRNQGMAPGTITKLVKKCLSSPFHSAWRLGKILVNPCAFVATTSKLTRMTGARKGTFTSEQVKAIVATATGDWKGLVLLAYYTGGRLQDLGNLRRSNVDLTLKLIRFHQRKTGSEIAIPMHPALEQYFQKTSADASENAFIFPSVANRAEGGDSGLSRQFSKLMIAAQIDNPAIRERKKDTKGRTVRLLSFHSLRHSFTSELANAGVAPELRQLLTGHADDATHAIYTHHDLERLREAVAKVPGI